MKILAVLMGLLMTSSLYADAGFTHGEEFDAHYIEGRLDVTCHGNGQTRYATYRCYDYYLTPAMFTKFYTDSGVDADKVKLVATNAKGKKTSKSSRFRSSKGQSKSSFNLWIDTLLQKSLLDYGDNVISYVLEKDGQEVQSGEFDVTVTKQPARYCQSAWTTSYDIRDCTFGDNICGRYLRQYYNTCR